MKKCVIFAAAPIKSGQKINIDSETVVVCADAGYLHAKKLGIKPDILLGDFDSFSKDEADDVLSVTFPTRKDDTDLMLAVKYAMEYGCDDFTIYGALGGKRLDHTVAAFSTLGFLMDNGFAARLVDGETIVELLSVGEYQIENCGSYISLFPFGCDSVTVNLEGTAYDGEVLLTSSFPLGVSNEVIADKAKIEVFQGDNISRVMLIRAPK